MVAAVRAIRSQSPKKVIVAAPVASPSAVDLLRNESDELVILDIPSDFYSISQFYDDFPQVTDDEVYRILWSAGKAPPKEAGAAA
jgi:putative phosphoribosyl transferase